MTKISFVYFDVGGVAVEDYSDSPKWDVMMKDMGLDVFDRKQVDAIYDSCESDICIGKMHVDEILPLYIKEFKLRIDPNFSMQKYFIDHFDKNMDLWPIIERVKKTTKVGLLTDMYPGLLDAMNAKGLLPRIDWDQIVDSSIVGIRKPMPEIYQLATELAGVPAQEILFIDNRKKNLVGARSAGWQTFHYDSSNYDKANSEFSNYLESIGF